MLGAESIAGTERIAALAKLVMLSVGEAAFRVPAVARWGIRPDNVKSDIRNEPDMLFIAGYLMAVISGLLTPAIHLHAERALGKIVTGEWRRAASR